MEDVRQKSEEEGKLENEDKLTVKGFIYGVTLSVLADNVDKMHRSHDISEKEYTKYRELEENLFRDGECTSENYAKVITYVIELCDKYSEEELPIKIEDAKNIFESVEWDVDSFQYGYLIGGYRYAATQFYLNGDISETLYEELETRAIKIYDNPTKSEIDNYLYYFLKQIVDIMPNLLN